MKKLIGLVTVAMVLIVLLVGCQTDDANKEVIEVMEKNLEALNNEDVDKYMSTLSEESPAYEQTKELIGKIFEVYDLENKLIGKMEVVEMKEDSAKVKMTTTSKKISGPEYKDNESTYINLLKKYEDGWKITNTELQETKFLDQE